MTRRILQRPGMLAVALAAACLGSAIAASSASAVLKRLPHGRVVSYMPTPQAAARLAHTLTDTDGDMAYNGGPIMPSNTDYMVMWSPHGLSAYPPEFVGGIARYFRDLAHDSGGNQNVDSVATQYGDLTGAFVHYDVTFGGVLVDTDPYPKSSCPVNGPTLACLSDPQLQAELMKFTRAHNLPHDLMHEYFLLTPPHVESCFTDQPPDFGGCSVGEDPSTLWAYCAYHGQTAASPMLFYAYDPFVPGTVCDDGNHPNGISDGELEGGLSHEHNESITDPIPNDAWTNGAGPNHGLEVGDECETQTGEPLGRHNGALYNQVINGHYYWYQPEWSNAGHTCLERYTPRDPFPTATFRATAGSGTTMTFDATGSNAQGGVAKFTWQFNDEFGASTVLQTTPSITHTFPVAGAYSIGLAVSGPSGISIGTGGIITTGHNGFTPGFTFSPTSPSTGQAVTFNALSTISRHPVTSTLWEFGDGTTGAGLSPTHTYEHPGTYHVVAVLFSGIGSAYPGGGAAPVVAETVTVR